MSTSWRRFGFEEGVEVACGDDWGAAPTVNKSVKTGPAGIVLDDTSWVDDEFVTCAVDNVTVWFDRDDGDGNGGEARPLKVRHARTRCRRLVFADGVGFPLIFYNVW